MLKLRSILLIIMLSSFFSLNAKADFTTDDSCTPGIGLLNRFIQSLTTFGVFEGYSENFHMYGAPGTSGTTGYGTGTDSTDGCSADYYPDSGGTAIMNNSTYCQENGTNCCPDSIDPSTGLPYPSDIGVPGGCSGDCNPAGGVEFCFDQEDSSGTTTCNAVWAQSGYNYQFYNPSAQLRVVSNGSYICVQFLTNLGYQSIGCKPLPSCYITSTGQSCLVAPSCYNYSSQSSKALLPITGAIMQCVNDTLQYLFYGNPSCDSADDNDLGYVLSLFPDFQSTMRNAVRSALVLFVILSGFKMLLAPSGGNPTKSEFAMVAAKFILVLYFSTGIQMNDGQVGTDGQPIYDDGIHRYMIPLFTSGASELADMIYSAGGSTGLCSYDPSLYPDNYAYLSMWDSLDCRILYYFGLDLVSIDVSSTTTLTPDDLGESVLLGLLVPAFFSFQLLFIVFSAVFAMIVVSVVVYFLNISVLSAVLVGILIYLAPIFVPMALFEVTKQYYDSWLKLIISYALQPMVVAAYIAMMISVFDQTMFGNCLFMNTPVNFQMDGFTKSDIPFFNVCDPTTPGTPCYKLTTGDCEVGQTTGCYSTSADVDSEYITQCPDTIGYYINPSTSISYTTSLSAIFFTITQLNSTIASDMTNGLVALCLFAYLFFKFAEVLSEFAAELTGGDAIGSSAGSPMAIAKKAAEFAKTAAKAAMEGGSKSGAKSSTSESQPKSNATSSTSDSKN